MSSLLHGVAGSPGVGLGPAYLLRAPAASPVSTGQPERLPEQSRAAEPAGDPAHERARWLQARQVVAATLETLAGRAQAALGDDEAAIFAAQAAMASDPELEATVLQALAQGRSAATATRDAIAGYAAMLSAVDDEYLRQRADDIREIGVALQRALAGGDPFPLAALPPGSVLCAPVLAAGTLLLLDRTALAGLALGSGGSTSHVTILARTMGIPAVVGLGDALGAIAQGQQLVVDGTRGVVHVAPAGEELATLQRAIHAQAAEQKELQALVQQPAVTPDGIHLDMWANIGGLADVDAALHAGAEGVGLFRTEFLVAGKATLPTEDEQYAIYRQVLERLGGRPVIFRTFDIGGDKPVPALALPSESNPFLGYRAVRIGLDRPDLLTTQFRAILRAADGYTARIMLPMISNLAEFDRVRTLYTAVQREFQQHVPLGIMVEIPATALIARQLARHVDFFSIGTNDLIQYTLAVDRTDERLAWLYQPFHPAVLRLIALTAEAATEAGITCGICGELAGNPDATALLIGLGVHELSMSPGSIGHVKREARRTPGGAARGLARDALACGSSEEVLARVQAFLSDLRQH